MATKLGPADRNYLQAGKAIDADPFGGWAGSEYDRIMGIQAGDQARLDQQAALEAASRASQMQGIGMLQQRAADDPRIAMAQAQMARNALSDRFSGAMAQNPIAAMRAGSEAGASMAGQIASQAGQEQAAVQNAYMQSLQQAQAQDMQRAQQDLAQAAMLEDWERQRHSAALGPMALGLGGKEAMMQQALGMFGGSAGQHQQPNFWTQQFIPGLVQAGGMGLGAAAMGRGSPGYTSQPAGGVTTDYGGAQPGWFDPSFGQGGYWGQMPSGQFFGGGASSGGSYY